VTARPTPVVPLVAAAPVERPAPPATAAELTAPDVAAFAWVGAFVDELSRAGVRDACVAPGSRSTPLTLALAHNESMRVWTHLDERSAAFFALGMAKTARRPVALVCTSGTAAANFLPAVVEARLSGVPLVVLTADRPPELRADVGAPQTIDQVKLYGSHAKWFVDAPLPEATPALLREARTLGARAAAVAGAAPAGPVHVNFPFREPLVPRAVAVPDWWDDDDRLAWSGRPDGEPWVRVSAAEREAGAELVESLGGALADARRPVIVCGPSADPAIAAPIAAVARRLDAPLLADPLSQLRFGSDPATLVVDGYDAFLRASLESEAAGALAPDLVLRVGALPTSKALQLWLRKHARVRQILLGDGGWSDPAQDVAWAVRADVASTCTQLDHALADMLGDTPLADADWAARWRRINAHTREILAAELESDDEMSEPRLFAELSAALPAGATLWVSSSMPVRDLDSFAAWRDERVRVLANRGGNGIDGVVSSALGAAAASDGPTVLAIGDLAFYHDMNGLLAAKLHDLDATVVLVNNDGGGIFSFLPQGNPELVAPRDFEALFGTPHGLDFSHAAALYGARFVRPGSWTEFHAALAAAVESPGLNIIEVWTTDRAANVERHRQLWAAVSAGMAELL
jgi:2-succinyl-5-enolpyruvyl-6-hydroxy-3-cyclohexene-1-carboxylate synthase